MKKLILSCLALLALASCSLPTRAPVTPSAWLVAPERTGTPYKPRTDFWLKIGSVSVAPPFDGRSLVYRLGDQRYEKDFYNIYSAIPADMIANAERQWFNQANIFSLTVGQGNSLFPYYTLQTTINEFYGDYRVRPEAVVSVEFILTVTNAGVSNPIIGANRYSKRIVLKDNTPQALALGQQQALAEIFKEYEVQLYQYTDKLPKPIGQ
jgi:cholesterol transport system auxiliary component